MNHNLLSSFFGEDEREMLPESLSFQFAPVQNPQDFVTNLGKAEGPEKKIAMFQKGTTTLGFKFKDGIILAVDSRASMGTFDSSETVRKVIEINDHMLGTMAGGAADCQFWEENLARIVALYELNTGEKLSIAGASNLFSNMLYGYKGYGLSLGTMIAGSDDKGTHLYYCDNDGIRLAGDKFAVGSGGTYAYGILDTYYRYDLSIEEAVTLGKRDISEATYMDSASGGVVRVYHVHSKGWTKLVEAEDNSELIWKHRKRNRVEFYEDEKL